MLNRNGIWLNSVAFHGVFTILLSLPSPIPADASIDDALSLSATRSLVFERKDGSALVITPSDDPVMRFVEIAGKDVVIRLVPMDSAGDDLGSGRVIVLAPLEDRYVRLRDELALPALSGVHLRAEVLRGDGRVMVTTSERNGPGLRPQAAGSSRRRPVRAPAPMPTSFALIDKAEVSGALDGETALIYRVFALFSDARLPLQYRGDDSQFHDHLYLATVRNRFSTLSAAAQIAVQPFLTPPVYVGSWASVTRPPVSASIVPPPCEIFNTDLWGYVDSSNGQVRVWHRLDRDLARARSIASEVDSTIWSPLSNLMFSRVLLEDAKEECSGGDGRLDVYLTDIERSEAVPFRGCPGSAITPSFILLRRTASDAAVAHEIFHTLQFAYPVGAGCITDPQGAYRWWMEASAQWSMEFVYPADDARHWAVDEKHSLAPLLLTAPQVSLHLKQEPHWYSAYLLPFFLQRIKGWSADLVRVSWERSGGAPAINALNQALPEQFAEVWPEFVKFNWNRPPVEDYTKLGMKHKGNGDNEIIRDITPEPEIGALVAYELPPLAATYEHFKFDTTDTARSVRFWNGATYELKVENRPPLGLQYSPKDAAEESIKGARVQALIKLRGRDWKVADWTKERAVSYCRDLPGQRIDELVLIVSNSEFADPDRKLMAPDFLPLVWASNIGCAMWKGIVTYTDPGFGLTITTNVEWKFDEAKFEWVASGKGEWTFSSPCKGNGSFTIDPTRAFLSLSNFTPSFNDATRSYFATGAQRQTIDFTCQEVPHQMTELVWWSTPAPPTMPGIPGARYLRVDDTGTVMEGSNVTSGAGWTWRFVALKQ